MKRGIALILFLLLAINITSAVEFDMKSNFSKGETLMAKVSGNFLKQPFKGTIKFYRNGHVGVPIEKEVAKINDEFYIYALLPENEGNYSIVIEDVKYYEGSQISSDDLVKNFIIGSSLADFSVEPGFVITNNDFSLEVQNLQNSKIDIQVTTEPLDLGSAGSASENESKGFFAFLFGDETVTEDINGDSSVTLKSGEIEDIKFKVEDIEEPVLKTIVLSSDNTEYEIPVYIFPTESGSTPKAKDRDFAFDPSELNFSMSTDSELTKITYLFNDGEDDLENISLEVSDSLKPYVSISPSIIDDLKEDKQVKIELKFETGSEDKTVEGQIKAKESEEGLDDIYAYISVNLNITEGYIPSDGNDDANGNQATDTGTKTCSELGGAICTDSQQCDESEVSAKDDKCCLGTCEAKVQSSTGKVIGWMIIIAIIIFLVWFFLKKWRK